MVDKSTSKDPTYRITEPNGCPTCGADKAIEGHKDIVVPNSEINPVCAGCGEILSDQVVEPINNS